LTDEVKLSAGISLSREVKDAAGRRTWFIEEVLGGETAVGCQGRLRRLLGSSLRFATVLLIASALLVAATPSPVEEVERELRAATHAARVALVIGNSDYRHTPRLENPRNDAADVGAALKSIGFRVIEGIDLDKAAFDAALNEFAAALEGADVGLFFYAGHGMQVAGRNYLVPVDAWLTSVTALDVEMVRLDSVQRVMVRAVQTSLLFLDACRDNPLTRSLASASGWHAPEIGRGLAEVASGAGTLISFSTQPGNVALDGAGRNSPFSAALAERLLTSHEDLNAVLISVRNDVMRLTDGRQVPWEHSALTRRLYLNPAANRSAAAADPQ
jgi:uncharacterized caspase-like protein